MTLLSDKRILEEIEKKRIIIRPFDRHQLGTNSYDVRLGQHFQFPIDDASIRTIPVDVTSEIEVRKRFRLITADDFVIIPPNITVLAHTIEIIGGKNGITTAMHARSSLGRLGISVCKCAGFGDEGFINIWTMELTNHNSWSVKLPIGLRIAQISFDQIGETTHSYDGKYGSQSKEGEEGSDWTPDKMIPKLWNDWDVSDIMLHKYVIK